MQPILNGGIESHQPKPSCTVTRSGNLIPKSKTIISSIERIPPGSDNYPTTRSLNNFCIYLCRYNRWTFRRLWALSF